MKPASEAEEQEYLPSPTQFFHIHLFLPNIRLLEDKDSTAVSMVGSSSARNKTLCQGCFIDLRGDGTPWLRERFN